MSQESGLDSTPALGYNGKVTNKDVKSKLIPVSGRRGEMSRIPHCLDSRLTVGGKVVSPTHRQRSTPKKQYYSASGTHFY
jgi:hypothetical protein